MWCKKNNRLNRPFQLQNRPLCLVRLLFAFEKSGQNHSCYLSSPTSPTPFPGPEPHSTSIWQRLQHIKTQKLCIHQIIRMWELCYEYIWALHRNMNNPAFRQQLRKGLCTCRQRTGVWICPVWVHSFQALWALKCCLLPLFLRTAHKTHFGRKEMGGALFYKGAKRSCVRKLLI